MPPKRNQHDSASETPALTFTSEQFNLLLSEILDWISGNASDVSTISVNAPVQNSNFAKCTARFNGCESAGGEAFIDYEDESDVKYQLQSSRPEEVYATEASTELEDGDNEPVEMMVEDVLLRHNEGVELTARERSTINELLQENAPIFALGGAATTFAEHRIVTKPYIVPIASPPYRIVGQEFEALQQEVETLERDIIEETESPWGAPVVVVPKRDGSMPLCVDYRGLNAVTVRDFYPMTRIDQLLHAAKNAKHMTTLDPKTGYYQVEVREKDKERKRNKEKEKVRRKKRSRKGCQENGREGGFKEGRPPEPIFLRRKRRRPRKTRACNIAHEGVRPMLRGRL